MQDRELPRITAQALKSHGLAKAPKVQHPAYFWDADFFGAAHSSAYKSLNPVNQIVFLQRMSGHILAEASSIETAGLTYAAKMNLSSATVDEKIIYSLIGAEEALHLKSLEPFLNPALPKEVPSFAGLIHHWIDKLERPSLLVMIQILLEGWGLTYYQSLALTAKDPNLQKVLRQILLDESRHHACGVLLYRHQTLSGAERAQLENELETLFSCVQIGPQQMFAELAILGTEKAPDFEKMITETDAVNESQKKLNKLNLLLEKTGDPRMISSALARDLFLAYPTQKMALIAEAAYLQILKTARPKLNRQSDFSL